MAIYKKGIWQQNNFYERLLPEGYVQLEYIESSGTQYIDTGINADSELKLYMDIQWTGGSTNYQNCFGAISTADGNKRFHFNPTSENVISAQIGTNDTSVFVYDGHNYKTRFQAIVDVPNLNITTWVNNTIQTRGLVTQYSDNFDLGITFWLFQRHGIVYPCYLRVYRFTMYRLDNLVRDFIPCCRKSDNAFGLYDLVNNVFYINQGTGTFIAGSQLSNENNTVKIYKEDNKVEANNFIEI